jgi:hypothetical protein
MPTCPAGHESASSDFCDNCGMRIGRTRVRPAPRVGLRALRAIGPGRVGRALSPVRDRPDRAVLRGLRLRLRLGPAAEHLRAGPGTAAHAPARQRRQFRTDHSQPR